MRRGLAKHKCL